MNAREVRIINGVQCHECTACLAWLPVTEFYELPNPDSKCGLRPECRACTSARHARDRQRKRLAAFAGAAASLFVSVQTFGSPTVEQVGHRGTGACGVNLDAQVQVIGNVKREPAMAGLGDTSGALGGFGLFCGHATNHTGGGIIRLTGDYTLASLSLRTYDSDMNTTTPVKGFRFLHAKWLDPSRMPEKVPALFMVTAVRQGCIYYRPVYDAGTTGERLGGAEYCTLDRWPKVVLREAEAV